jgi:hypothetical protein
MTSTIPTLERVNRSASDILTDVKRTLHILHGGRPCEVRILKIPGRGRPSNAAGYYDDYHLAAEHVSKCDVMRQPAASYVVLNEINPALMARSPNCITDHLEPTASDHDILRRRWWLVDCDPLRPAGISATDSEFDAARRKCEEVYDHLRERLFPDCIVAESGNGMHLLYPMELPNDPQSLATVNGMLTALQQQYGDSEVCIDVKVGNAARITKLYGTWTRKGFDTPDRPHRRSRMIYVPDYLDWRPA